MNGVSHVSLELLVPSMELSNHCVHLHVLFLSEELNFEVVSVHISQADDGQVAEIVNSITLPEGKIKTSRKVGALVQVVSEILIPMLNHPFK